MNDFTGKKFGSWTVIKDSGERKKVNGRSRVIVWECKCDCGTVRKVSGRILLNESKPRSCGCIRKKNSQNHFHSLYEKTPGCWIWKGGVNTHGYGKIGTKKSAHREAYKYVYGEIPPGKQVCHTCDNRLCVNPAHFFLGSIGDNMRDRTTKNRQAKGSQIASSVLNEEKVLNIRQLRLKGWEYQALADLFKVNWYVIRCVCKNVTWKHVALGEECAAYKSKAWGYSKPRDI